MTHSAKDAADPARPLTTYEWGLLILGIALLAALPWTADTWPTQDGPNHIATAHILERCHDEGSPFARYLTLQPVTTRSGYSLNPSNLQYVLLLLLHNFAGPAVAMKLLLSLTLAALPLSLVLLLLRTVPGRVRNIFWLLPLFSGWALGMGFVRYLLACVFGFLMIAFASGVRGGRRSRPWEPARGGLAAAAAAFFFCTWSHPFIAVLFGAALVVLEAGALRRIGGWVRLAVIAGPGAFLVILCTLQGTHPAESFAGATEWWGPGDILWGVLGYHTGFSFLEYFPRGAALLFLYAAAFLGCRGILRQGSAFQTSACRAVLLFHFLYLVLPAVWDGWYYCSARSLIIGAYLLPLVMKTPESRKMRAWSAAAALLLAVAVFCIQVPQARGFSSEIDDIADIGNSVPRGSRLLPICGYGSDLPNPLHHAWAVLVPGREVVSPYHSAAGKPGTGGGRFRALAYLPGVLDPSGPLPWIDEGEVRDACIDSPERCRETVDRLMPVFRKYDYILLLRPPEPLRAIARSEFVLERKSGEAYLLRAMR